MSSNAEHGITGAVAANLPVWMTMVAFSAIALYNVLELNVIIYSTFRQRRGLYFWSFLIATWGIVPHVVGFLLKFFDVTPVWWLPVALVSIGWYCMVSGQSFVLYSRLHLVVRGEWRIRWVLYMIIFNAVVIGIPDMTLAWLVNRPGTKLPIINAFLTFDKVQVGVYVLQESIISILYIYETVRLLGPARRTKQDPIRKLLTHLILVNILVLIFDATLLGTEYSGNFEIQTTYKPAIYSIKLKIEFSILNRLVGMVKNKGLAYSSNQSSRTMSYPLQTLNDVVLLSGSNNSVDDTLKSQQQSTEKTVELGVTPTDWSGQKTEMGEPKRIEHFLRMYYYGKDVGPGYRAGGEISAAQCKKFILLD